MKLGAVAVFAAGYVIGAKAGRERYRQIVEGVARASQRLEEFSSSRPPGPPRPPGGQEQRSDRPDGGP